MPQGVELRRALLEASQGVAGLPLYYSLTSLALLVLVLFLAVAPLLPAFREGRKRFGFLGSDALFVGAVVVFFLAARWPALLAPLLNHDEGYFLSAAMALFKDPVYWRSGDVTTSGPLNVYPLALPGLFGLRLDYASGRLIGLLALAVLLGATFYTFRRLYDSRVARLAALPAALAFAPLRNADFVHFTSEHVPIALLAVLVYLLSRAATAPSGVPGRPLLFCAGFVVGLIPYAKLQATPMVAVLFCCFLHLIWTRERDGKRFLGGLVALGAGALLFSAILAALLGPLGELDDAWKSYVVQNLFFSNFSGGAGEKVRILITIIRTMPETRLLVVLAFLVGAVGLPLLLLYRRRRPAPDAAEDSATPARASRLTFAVYAALYTLVSTYAVAQPTRLFFHYELFIVASGSLMVGCFVAECLRMAADAETGKKWRVAFRAAVALVLASQSLWVARTVLTPNEYLEKRTNYLAEYRSPLAEAVLRYGRPGDYLVIWGWQPGLHIETGLVQGTRDSIPVWQMFPNPQREYQEERFLADLRRNRPRVFVDSQIEGDMSYFWNGINGGARGEHYTTRPAIKRAIEETFELAETVEGVKVFRRRDGR
jgi:hypothetical protein